MSGLGVDRAAVNAILQKAPVILKADMSLKEAEHYAQAVARAGGRVKIGKHGHSGNSPINQTLGIKAFEDFIMCPQCGYKQLKMPSCVRCGFHLGNNTG